MNLNLKETIMLYTALEFFVKEELEPTFKNVLIRHSPDDIKFYTEYQALYDKLKKQLNK